MSTNATLDMFLSEQKETPTEERKEKVVIRDTQKNIMDYESTLLKELYSLAEPKEVEEGQDLFLLSVEYDSERNTALLKFYDENTGNVLIVRDKTNHRPYFLTNQLTEMQKEEIKKRYGEKVIKIEDVTKYHPLMDKTIKMSKIIVSDPLAVGGRGGLREKIGEDNSWEAWIPYHLNYIYDNYLWPSHYHKLDNGIAKPLKLSELKVPKEKIDEILSSVEDDLKPLAEKFLPALLARIPEIEFISVDIEVAGGGRIPQSDEPIYPIIAISLTGVIRENKSKKDVKIIMLYERAGIENNVSIKREEGAYKVGEINVGGQVVEARIYTSEKIMLLDFFKMLYKAPIIVTFNGDNFDFRYMVKRARHIGIPDKVIPIKLSAKGPLREARIRYGVHIDLYKFYSNAAIKVYSFSNKYDNVSLDAIAEALLGKRKIEVKKEEIEKLTLLDLAKYCWWDSYLTAELFKMNNWLPFKLMVTLSRITRMPIFEVTRRGVSSWIENWFYAEHRERNYLIPNPYELSEKDKRITRNMARLPPVIKGKRYRGAIVFTPKQGIWFNVWVLDFASIYPTIIKVHNISYETLCCVHEECKDNKLTFSANGGVISEYWVCKKRRGITSELIGFIRDLRVNYFKKKAKKATGEEKEFLNVIQGALKVLINASYGVFGAEHFPLFSLIVAESITGLGREKIMRIAEKARELGLTVIYGDTDSIFISNPKPEVVNELINWSSRVLKVDLEVDKIYKYVAFSARKKNYFGILQDGSPDIKGLMGKKRNTPEFLKKEFKRVIEILRNVSNEAEMEQAKRKVKEVISEIFKKIQKKQYDLEDLAFKVQLTKPISAYTKTTPQHVKAAKKLDREPLPGEIISYIKTKSGVEPLEIALKKRTDWRREVDWQKYEEYTKSVFDQLLDALGMDIEQILSESKGVTDITKFFS